MSDVRLACSTCPFWTWQESRGAGECRVNPPVARVVEHVTRQDEIEVTSPAVWPQTEHDDWCARHPLFPDPVVGVLDARDPDKSWVFPSANGTAVFMLPHAWPSHMVEEGLRQARDAGYQYVALQGVPVTVDCECGHHESIHGPDGACLISRCTCVEFVPVVGVLDEEKAAGYQS